MEEAMSVISSLAAAALAGAPGADEDRGALADRVILDLRLRYEHVDQDGSPEEADALTARARFGWVSPEHHDLQLLVEGEAVGVLIDDYNDTINGRVGYPVVADPEVVELNRAQIAWTGIEDTTVTVGRQRVILDDARFVGNVGFRQNEQTYDAARVATGVIPGVTVNYAYIDRVHRIFGDDSPVGEFDSDSHLLNAAFDTPVGTITGYGYLVDLEDAPAVSSQTWGARLTGGHELASGWRARYAAAYARQSDYGDNPASFDHDYASLKVSLDNGPFSIGGGFERLDGDGATAFTTPLATLHAFQGWADVFLATPPEGIDDYSLQAAWTFENFSAVGDLTVRLVGHEYEAVRGGGDLGSEIDAVAGLSIGDRWSLELKAAAYDGDGSRFADRTKVWTALSYAF
jgi:hypothetical protein